MLAVLGFFLLVAKALPWYVAPALPLMAALLALWLVKLRGEAPPPWVLAGIGALATLGVGVQLLAFDPFAIRARTVPVNLLTWREGALWIAPLAALVAAAALWWVQRRVGARSGVWISTALAACLLAGGASRVLPPLAGIERTSAMEQLRHDLDRLRAEGRPIDFPVPVTEPGKLRVRYWFGDDFEIVRARQAGREGAFFFLVGEGSTPGDPPLAPTDSPLR